MHIYVYKTTLSVSVSITVLSVTVTVSIAPLGALPVAFCDTKQIQINDSTNAEKNRAINCVFTFCLQNASAYQRDKAAADGGDEAKEQKVQEEQREREREGKGNS